MHQTTATDPAESGQEPVNAAVDDAVERMLADLRELVQIERRSATGGERESARWISQKLAAAGITEVKLRPYRGQTTWALPHAAHLALGLAAAALGGGVGRGLAAVALLSYELDTSARSQWVRRLLPGGHGLTVEATIPAAGPVKRRVIIVAHHDAAHTGLVWHPAFVQANRRRSARTGKAFPSHALPSLALALVASGPSRLRLAAGSVLGLALGLAAQAAASKTVPGANDNGTGVVASLELARHLSRHRLSGVEAILLFPGSEETGAAGMLQWMRQYGRRYPAHTTLVIGLDAIGSGGEVITTRRDGFSGWFRVQDLDILDGAAADAGLPPVKRVTFPNVTDALVARHAGMPAMSILSYEDGWIRNLHLPQDTVENVRWDTVTQALRLAQALCRRWARGGAGTAAP